MTDCSACLPDCTESQAQLCTTVTVMLAMRVTIVLLSKQKIASSEALVQWHKHLLVKPLFGRVVCKQWKGNEQFEAIEEI